MNIRALGAVVVALFVATAHAADMAGGPAATTTSATTGATTGPGAASQPLSVTITGVEGLVQVRDDEGQPWRKATVGMVVGEGAEFRTGPRAAVRCFLPPNQTVTLDRLGTVKLLTAIQQGNVVKTRVGMPYGRTRYDVEAAGVEHQSELVTPSSTLAIRGTEVSVFDQPPFAPSAVSLTGRAEYRTARRQIAFGGKGQGKTQVSSESESAAAGALLQTYVDPSSSFGRPATDQKLINQLQAKGDIVLNNGQLALAFGPAVTDRQLTNIISGQGRFNVSLRWFGPGDFDLFVLTPDPATGLPTYTLGNPSYGNSVFKDIGFIDPSATPPVTAARTPDGGQIKFDQVAFGGGGIELASWNTPVPQVGYTVAILYYNQKGKIDKYPDRSKFRVDAFLDGKPVPVLTNIDEVFAGTATELVFGRTYEGTASLVEGEQLLPVPAGDIRITAIDLTPEALDLDGVPIGVINPGENTVTANATRGKRGVKSAVAVLKPSATPLPLDRPTVKIAPATVKPVKPAAVKPAAQPKSRLQQPAAAQNVPTARSAKGR